MTWWAFTKKVNPVLSLSKKRKSKSGGQTPAATIASPQGNFRLWAICVGALLLAWAGIYLPHLRSSPRWYGDEFVTLLEGDAIWNHTFANCALRYSFFSGWNYQPVACYLYAVASHLFSGGDILGARIMATFLGLLTALAAFHLLYLRGLVVEGVAAAVIILGAPESVVHFRWVYPHHYVSLAVVIIGLTLDLPRTARRDWIIGLACGCAALAHLLVIHVTLAALLVRWRHPGAWWRIAIPPAVVLSLSLCFSYLVCGRQLFADMYELYLQYSGHNDGNGWFTKVETFWRFFTWDYLHVLYVAGLVILAFQRRWALVAFASLVSFAVIQNRPELPVFYYQAMIFTPLLAVCLACALQSVFQWVLQLEPALNRFPRSKAAMLIVFAALLPGFLLAQALNSSFTGTIISRNDYWVAPSDPDMEETADWINHHAGKDDLVIAFWDLGWMLKGRWTDMLQCAVWQYGNNPEFYKRMHARSEFLFPADLSTARYVVVDALDLRWGYGEGHVPQLIHESNLQSWPRVAGTASTLVLENPKFFHKVQSP